MYKKYRDRFHFVPIFLWNSKRLSAKFMSVTLPYMSIWFGLLIIVVIMVAAVVITYFIQNISAEISAHIGFTVLMLQIGTTVGIFLIL